MLRPMWLYGAFLYGSLLLCGVITIFTLRRYDLRPTEPWHTVVFTFVLGAGLMWAAGAGQDFLVHRLVSEGYTDLSDLSYALLAGITEETAKLMTVIATCFLFRKYFEEHSDGIYYGAFAGLGAAVLESIHTLGWPSNLSFLPVQEPVRLAGHLVMGAVTCGPLGLLAVNDRRWMWAVPLFLVLGAGLHAGWDWVAYSSADAFRDTGILPWYYSLASIAIMFSGLQAFRMLTAHASKLQHLHANPPHVPAHGVDTIRP